MGQADDQGVANSALIWRDLLIKTLEIALLSQSAYLPEIAAKTEVLLKEARDSRQGEDAVHLNYGLSGLLQKLELHAVAQPRIHDGLIQLLRLLIENMSQLSLGDQALHGQIQMIRAIIDRPINSDLLDDAKEKLTALLARQTLLKHSLLESKQALKSMAGNCVEILAYMSSSAGEYHNKIEGYQQRIHSIDDIVELNEVLTQLRQDALDMQQDALRNHRNLQLAHEKMFDAERLIDQLSQELDECSQLAYRDFLTGLLNRRGMEDAIKREFDRAERTHKPMCMAIMDIDHFKKINDMFGHKTGDQAIQHLVEIVKIELRVTDILARYGGEEFLIMLPETQGKIGVDVLTRLQHELTRNLFMHDNERILITFSAGITERQLGEDADVVMKRVDDALYQAKHAGRNRVVAV